MKTLFSLLITLLSLSFTSPSFAFPELPFCPAGGPPGWLNRFTHNHDHYRWRNQNTYRTPQHYRPAYNQPGPYTPVHIPRNTRFNAQRPSPEQNRYYHNQR